MERRRDAGWRPCSPLPTRNEQGHWRSSIRGRYLRPDDETSREELVELRERWGTQEFSDELLQWGCPTLYADDDRRRWFANHQRVGMSPAVAYALNRAAHETDLREVFPAVRVPTLVLYRSPRANEALNVAAQISVFTSNARLRR